MLKNSRRKIKYFDNKISNTLKNGKFNEEQIFLIKYYIYIELLNK